MSATHGVVALPHPVCVITRASAHPANPGWVLAGHGLHVGATYPVMAWSAVPGLAGGDPVAVGGIVVAALEIHHRPAIAGVTLSIGWANVADRSSTTTWCPRRSAITRTVKPSTWTSSAAAYSRSTAGEELTRAYGLVRPQFQLRPRQDSNLRTRLRSS
jgi:hypothetical protein